MFKPWNVFVWPQARLRCRFSLLLCWQKIIWFWQQMLPVLSCAPIRGREVSDLTSSGMWRSSLNTNYSPAPSLPFTSPASYPTTASNEFPRITFHPFFCHSNKRKWGAMRWHGEMSPIRAICRRLGGIGDLIAGGRCIVSIQLLAIHSALAPAPKHNRVGAFMKAQNVPLNLYSYNFMRVWTIPYIR